MVSDIWNVNWLDEFMIKYFPLKTSWLKFTKREKNWSKIGLKKNWENS